MVDVSFSFVRHWNSIDSIGLFIVKKFYLENCRYIGIRNLGGSKVLYGQESGLHGILWLIEISAN